MANKKPRSTGLYLVQGVGTLIFYFNNRPQFVRTAFVFH